MMIQIPQPILIRTLLTWLVVVVALALLGWNPFGLLWVLGVPLLCIVPGALTLVVLRLTTTLSRWSQLLLAVGLSLLELMVVGFAGNAILPHMGVARPLDTFPILLQVSALILTLLMLARKHLATVVVTVPRFWFAETKRDAWWIFVPALFVVASVIGALRLNVGEGNGVTISMLVGVALYSFFLVRHAEARASQVIPTAIFLLSLALLLMTSLRGWYISGHDIQREFFVFQLTKNAGLWNIAVYQDAYNACLSITILPTILSQVLHIADAYIYKVLYQCMFALVPVALYLIARRVLAVPYAFLATFLFIAFPTFFQDMPFLVRQEVAFLFLGLMLMMLYEEGVSVRMRRVLFFVFGVGVVLSHYSTTYTVLLVFVGAVVAVPFVRAVMRWGTRVFAQTGVVLSGGDATRAMRVLTFLPVGTILIVCVVWTVGVTSTDGHLREVLQSTLTAVRGGVDGEAHSVDVLSIFSFDRVETEHTLDAHVREVVIPRRAESPDEFYATSAYAEYPLVTLQGTTLPVTPMGALVRFGPMSLGDLVSFFGKVLAKVMQVAILLGVVYVLFRRKYMRAVDVQFVTLALMSIAFVVSCIVLPVLSKEYGLFRALQQSLFVLAPFMVVGALLLGEWFSVLAGWWVRFVSHGKVGLVSPTGCTHTTAYVFSVVFFLYTSGVLTQLVGGNVPPVHLNNVGDDYKHYILEASEYKAIQWLKGAIEREHEVTGRYPLVQSDRFGEKKLHAYLTSPVGGDMFPGSVHKDAYVFVTPAVRYSGTATVSYAGETLRYAYPIDFLRDHKNLVYTNGDVEIYR
ncbi:MAG: DUF2206 domain-containing protein [Candidatus Pacebacteria bacterium]|nr:DUF2206 domain-containing protein [Candidatus Paceibacterota bacterium]